jgi:hypothetical protein
MKIKLDEYIAKHLYEDWGKRASDADQAKWEDLPQFRKVTYREWVKTYIFALVYLLARHRAQETLFKSVLNEEVEDI